MRILVLGAAITPTKPLVATHMKGMIWLETALRVARLRHQIDCVANTARTLSDATIQTTRFWSHLDADPARRVPSFYDDKDELWVGREYVASHHSPIEVNPELVTTFRRRIETEGWTHPSSSRVLACWAKQYADLGVTFPASERPPVLMPEDEALARLGALDCLLDMRELGGGIYLDLTGEGVPLRAVVDEQGLSNYVLQVLRLLLAVGAEYDLVTLFYDLPIDADFALVAKILGRGKISVQRIAVGRMAASDASTGTTRQGAWQGDTCGELIARYLPVYGPEVFRLGLRFYFIQKTPLKVQVAFSHDELERCFVKANRIVDSLGDDARTPATPDEVAAVVGGLLDMSLPKRTGLVDPHTLINLLLMKDNLRNHGRVLMTLCS